MLLHPDRFLTLADFRAYVTSQELVSQLYRPGTKRPIMSSSIQTTVFSIRFGLRNEAIVSLIWDF